MRYGSLCSGIEAATVTWEPLGWEPVWFAEIEAFPSEVLQYHYPSVPNLGDITADDFIDRAKEQGDIDVLVGGPPCQSFSVAGLRQSIADDRGNLSLRFVEIMYALRPTVTLWENVPGVLSTKDNAFGCFLAAMVGADGPLVPPEKRSKRRWTNAGVVSGPEGRAAWRILDAQYFRVPQRRRRVFVVRCAGNGPDPVEVLFESTRLLRHPPTRREAREETARDAGEGTAAGSGAYRVHGEQSTPWDIERCRVHRGRDIAPTLSEGSGQRGQKAPTVAVAIQEDNQNGVCIRDTAGSLRADVPGHQPCGTLVGCVEVAPPLGCHASGSGQRNDLDNQTYAVCAAVAPASDQSGRGVARTGDSRGQDPVVVSNSGSETWTVGGARQVAHPGRINDSLVCVNAQETPVSSGHDTLPLGAQDRGHAVAFTQNTRDEVRYIAGDGQLAGALSAEAGMKQQNYVAFEPGNLRRECGSEPAVNGVAPRVGATKIGDTAPHVAYALQVRRLTPTECLRLQGFPDHWTKIPWRGKPAEDCPDGPQYRAVGNSMAVPVIRWIGRRIQAAMEAYLETLTP